MRVTLYDRAELSITSGQPGLWIRTHEPDEALATLSRLASDYADQETRSWCMWFWDISRGLQQPLVRPTKAKSQSTISNSEASSGLAAIKVMVGISEAKSKEDKSHHILVIRNGHLEIAPGGQVNKEVVTTIQRFLLSGKAKCCHLIILSFPGIEIPTELREQFWTMDHELPTFQDRQEIMEEILNDFDKEIPENLDDLVHATVDSPTNRLKTFVQNL